MVDAIHEAMRVMKHGLRTTFDRVGLSWEQFLTLHLIATLPSPTSSSLAKCLNVSPPTVSASLNHLDGAGFVTRRRSERDRRAVELHLTARGRSAEAQVWRAMARFTLAAARAMSADSLQTAARTLHEMCVHAGESAR